MKYIYVIKSELTPITVFGDGEPYLKHVNTYTRYQVFVGGVGVFSNWRGKFLQDTIYDYFSSQPNFHCLSTHDSLIPSSGIEHVELCSEALSEFESLPLHDRKEA